MTWNRSLPAQVNRKFDLRTASCCSTLPSWCWPSVADVAGLSLITGQRNAAANVSPVFGLITSCAGRLTQQIKTNL